MDLEELREKLELWKGAWPELAKTALQGGGTLVQEEIKRRWSGGVIQSITGRLVNAVKVRTSLNPLYAKITVDPKQQYKAQVFEQGRTIQAAAGGRSQRRYKITNKAAFMQIGPSRYGNYYYGRPRSVTIAARPVFKSSLEERKQQVFNLISWTIMQGYKKL
jgi:hypothetical protein